MSIRKAKNEIRNVRASVGLPARAVVRTSRGNESHEFKPQSARDAIQNRPSRVDQLVKAAGG
jgi:hypothetical protein